MGRPRCYGRDVNGVLLLDKPKGISSNSALQTVKRLYKANRAGHAGTLDPLATGMLPICMGEATKFSSFLLNSDKLYRVIAKLGQRTDSSDANGQVVQRRLVNFTKAQLDAALDNFCGELKQFPSMYSALKYRGKPLYKYARKGLSVPRSERSIKIYRLQLLNWENDELELEIHCSKGTYIRTIIDDLGELLFCGAHVIYLRRVQVADYPIKSMVTLDHLHYILKQEQSISFGVLLDLLLLPIDTQVQIYPEVNLLPLLALQLKQGQLVFINDTPSSGLVRITEGKNRKFIGIGTIADDGRLLPRRLVATNDFYGSNTYTLSPPKLEEV